MRSDFDFGLPYIEFRVSLRELYMRCPGIQNVLFRTDPYAVETLLKKMVETARPTLEGCVIVSMRQSGGMNLYITVVHPSLGKVKIGSRPSNEVCLEPCYTCGKDVPADNVYRHAIQLPETSPYLVKEVVLCGPACVPPREDYSARVVEVPPQESWSVEPEIYDKK